MAQGRQRRLPLDHPKQLLTIGGETILARIVRMVREIGPGEIHIVGWPTFAGLGDSKLHTFNEPGSCILEGIAGSRLLFDSERTVILLGDVVYSVDALQCIYHDPRPVFAAGNSDLSNSSGELFAFSFIRDQEAHVLSLIHTRRCFGQPHVKYQPGHLRKLFWALQGGRLVREGCRQWKPEFYLPIDDWTMDVDTPADLVRLCELEGKIDGK